MEDSALEDMIVASGYYRKMADVVRALEMGMYDSLLLLFENHQNILDTLKTFKNAKHSLSVGFLTGADRQALSALPKCGSAALHYLCFQSAPTVTQVEACSGDRSVGSHITHRSVINPVACVISHLILISSIAFATKDGCVLDIWSSCRRSRRRSSRRSSRCELHRPHRLFVVHFVAR